MAVLSDVNSGELKTIPLPQPGQDSIPNLSAGGAAPSLRSTGGYIPRPSGPETKSKDRQLPRSQHLVSMLRTAFVLSKSIIEIQSPDPLPEFSLCLCCLNPIALSPEGVGM